MKTFRKIIGYICLSIIIIGMGTMLIVGAIQGDGLWGLILAMGVIAVIGQGAMWGLTKEEE